jgi:hypothetical protein
MVEPTKQPYAAPRIVDYGALSSLTLGDSGAMGDGAGMTKAK